jgi:hypothetical protein
MLGAHMPFGFLGFHSISRKCECTAIYEPGTEQELLKKTCGACPFGAYDRKVKAVLATAMFSSRSLQQCFAPPELPHNEEGV